MHPTQADRIATENVNLKYPKRKSFAYLMAVLLPSDGLTAASASMRSNYGQITHRKCLQRQNGCSAAQDAEPVFHILLVECQPAGQADNSGLDALRLELVGGFQRNADLASGADNGEILILLIVEDITTARGLLDGGPNEVGQVLA